MKTRCTQTVGADGYYLFLHFAYSGAFNRVPLLSFHGLSDCSLQNSEIMKTIIRIVVCILTVSLLATLAKAEGGDLDTNTETQEVQVNRLSKQERLTLLEQRIIALEKQLKDQSAQMEDDHQWIRVIFEDRLAKLESRIDKYFLWGLGALMAFLGSVTGIRLINKKPMPNRKFMKPLVN
jgi:hypothetical protein